MEETEVTVDEGRSGKKAKKRKEFTEEDWIGRCSYVLPKKNRRCKMLIKEGRRFCGEHAVFEPSDETRVHCPLDPRHTVLRSELEAHVAKKCNSRFVEREDTEMNVNAVEGETGYFEKIDYRPSEDEIRFVIEILDRHSDLLVSGVEDSIPDTTVGSVQKYLDDTPEMGPEKRRHLTQINNIVANMSSSGLLHNSATKAVCDLGAGKAQLTYFTALEAPLGRYLVVDRMGARNKWDNRLKKDHPEIGIHRIRCSIEHLDLRRVAELKSISGVVGLCKHLCGSGTDAGVRCMMKIMEKEGDGEDKEEVKEDKGDDGDMKKTEKEARTLDGLVLAPCCAHKSRYAEYIGTAFLSATLGIGTRDHFAALRHIATWATCGLQECDDDGEDGRWSSSWKSRLGRLAKAAIEMGRARAIEERGFTVRVIRYVAESISPENLLILAKRI